MRDPAIEEGAVATTVIRFDCQDFHGVGFSDALRKKQVQGYNSALGMCTAPLDNSGFRMKRSLAQLPLHRGRAPAWLFKRMTDLAGAVTMTLVEEFGPEELLRRLSDPWWFQAFGCLLGFDWHSSGVTTVTCGALKEATKKYGDACGIIAAGGKGRASRKTPDEIRAAADRLSVAGGEKLVYASRMSAKVDSAAVQDGFAVYHHSFFFTRDGKWCVVQQGMDEASGWARRYHWLGEDMDDFVCEPHEAIQNLSEGVTPRASGQQSLLNMVAEEADSNRTATASLILENPDWVMDEMKRVTQGPTLFAPERHPIMASDVDLGRLRKIVVAAHEEAPEDFETLLGTRGVGPATIRSLVLLAEIIFKAPVSRREPNCTNQNLPQREVSDPQWADYAYAHGGKDGTPFPVDCSTYDQSIFVLVEALRRAKLGENEKMNALKRLARISKSV